MVSRGICGQRGFSEFSLVNKLTGNSSMVAVNPANPSYRPLCVEKMNQPILKTNRLLLRPFQHNDKSAIQKLAGNKKVSDTTLTIPHPYTLNMAEEWLSTHEHDWLNKSRVTYAIARKKDNELLGSISLVEINCSIAKLGYWIGEPYWGNGYCTEALNAILTFAFNEIGLEKIVAEHLSSNPASGRVMQKNEMQHINSAEMLDRNKELAKVEIYEITAT